jgi:hypothetical protein
MHDAILTQIRLRLSTDPAFAARLRSNFAGTLSADGYLATLPIGDLPAVYRWHRDLRAGRYPTGARSLPVSHSNPHPPPPIG